MTIHPQWPYIVVIAGLLACAYAGLVAWLNNHRRWGRFWSEHAWLEVVAGNLFIAGTIWALGGFDTFVLLVGTDALWGVPMIVAVLIANMKRQAEEHDQADAEHVAQKHGQ